MCYICLDRSDKLGIISKNVVNQLIRQYEEKGVYDIYTSEKLGTFLNHRGGGICVKGTTEHNLAEVFFEDEETTQEERKQIIEEINDKINTIIDITENYFTEYQDYYKDLISDEQVAETLKINEYEFDAETLKIYF